MPNEFFINKLDISEMYLAIDYNIISKSIYELPLFDDIIKARGNKHAIDIITYRITFLCNEYLMDSKDTFKDIITDSRGLTLDINDEEILQIYKNNYIKIIRKIFGQKKIKDIIDEILIKYNIDIPYIILKFTYE